MFEGLLEVHGLLCIFTNFHDLKVRLSNRASTPLSGPHVGFLILHYRLECPCSAQCLQ